MKVLAGIVAYRPDVDRLRENIAAISPQVDSVAIFVNGSESESCVRMAAEDYTNAVLIVDETNEGIATGLARVMDYAMKNRFEWVLSIDQDSLCRPGLVEEYWRFVSLPNAGVLTCCITDRNFSQDSGFEDGQEWRQVEKCITAGSFMSVAAYARTAGYDESMFIDGVDWDICYALRRAGYCIYQINFDGVLQEVGHGKNVRLLWKKYIAYGESPLRNYYGARNDIYLARKYPEFLSMKKVIVREVRAEMIVLLYEGQKTNKLWNRWRGLRDGFRMPTDVNGV